MIERKLIKENIREFQIHEYISKTLKNIGHSATRVQRTPLGEKIVVYASRPGLVVGRKGENIKKLTAALKSRFKLENPQIEISEVENVMLDAQIVAERIASTLERFGLKRFKAVGHRTLSDVMSAKALGAEIIIKGKVPSQRARSWRFYQGYLKKCGDIAIEGVHTAHASAHLKSGKVGIRVKIMPRDIQLPDNIVLSEELVEEIKEITPEKKTKKVAKKKIQKKTKKIVKNKPENDESKGA